MQNNTPETTQVSEPRCFAHHHMTAAEYGFYDVCRSLSQGNNRDTLYFSGRRMAERFGSMAKSTAYNLAASLTEKGWLKLQKKPVFVNGRYSPTIYKVLSHDQWAAEHKGTCVELAARKSLSNKRPSPDCDPVRLGEKLVHPHYKRVDSYATLVHPGDTLVQNTDNLVHPDYNLVQNPGPNLYNPTYSKQLMSSTSTPAGLVQKQGPLSKVNIDRWSKSGKKRAGAKSAEAAQHFERAPVPDSGPAVSDAVAAQRVGEVNSLVAHIVACIYRHPSFGVPWKGTIRRLLNAGQEAGQIKEVFDFVVIRYGANEVRTRGSEGFETHIDRFLKEWIGTLFDPSPTNNPERTAVQ